MRSNDKIFFKLICINTTNRSIINYFRKSFFFKIFLLIKIFFCELLSNKICVDKLQITESKAMRK